MDDVKGIWNALTELNEDQALQLIRQALKNNVPAKDVLSACQEAMIEIGKRFERQEYFVCDLIMSGEIFKEISAILEPHLGAGGGETSGKVVFGTVKGDIHDIGKDVVVNMLRSAQFEVIDLGTDVPAERFVEALKESHAHILGMSGLLTLAFDSMRETIAAVASAGLRDEVKIMVGGGPVDANVCKSVGADDWGADAHHAVTLAKKWSSAVAA